MTGGTDVQGRKLSILNLFDNSMHRALITETHNIDLMKRHVQRIMKYSQVTTIGNFIKIAKIENMKK